MLLYHVFVLAIEVSFSAFVRCFIIIFLHVVLNLRPNESHVCTAQIGRKTPSKGSYSSLHVVITKKQY